MSPADGHDVPGLVEETVPGGPAVFEDVVLGVENPVGEPATGTLTLSDQIQGQVISGRSCLASKTWRFAKTGHIIYRRTAIAVEGQTGAGKALVLGQTEILH